MCHEVDVNSPKLVRPHSIRVEYVSLAAAGWLKLQRIVEQAGLNGADSRPRSTVTKPKLQSLYDVLGLSTSPVATRKLVN